MGSFGLLHLNQIKKHRAFIQMKVAILISAHSYIHTVCVYVVFKINKFLPASFQNTLYLSCFILIFDNFQVKD